MFYRKVTIEDPSYWNIELRGSTTTWAILTAITNVNEQRPIVSASVTSCDGASDSVFPSVFGRENDVLLLSQSFDDTASIGGFMPPAGTSLLGWTRSEDEVSAVRLFLKMHFIELKYLKSLLFSLLLPRLDFSTERGSTEQESPESSSPEVAEVWSPAAPEVRSARTTCCRLL
jgi:hypothetical protein